MSGNSSTHGRKSVFDSQPVPGKYRNEETKQAGCTIGEMVEINLREAFYGEGYEKGHAFRITLN